MKEMKVVSQGKARIVHVETALGIVNIYGGLKDHFGRRVEAVEIIPNNYAGEPRVIVSGHVRSRMIELKKKGGK